MGKKQFVFCLRPKLKGERDIGDLMGAACETGPMVMCYEGKLGWVVEKSSQKVAIGNVSKSGPSRGPD